MLRKEEVERKILKKYIDKIEDLNLTYDTNLSLLEDYFRCHLFDIENTKYYAVLGDEGNGYMQVIEIVDSEKAEHLKAEVERLEAEYS